MRPDIVCGSTASHIIDWSAREVLDILKLDFFAVNNKHTEWTVKRILWETFFMAIRYMPMMIHETTWFLIELPNIERYQPVAIQSSNAHYSDFRIINHFDGRLNLEFDFNLVFDSSRHHHFVCNGIYVCVCFAYNSQIVTLKTYLRSRLQTTKHDLKLENHETFIPDVWNVPLYRQTKSEQKENKIHSISIWK